MGDKDRSMEAEQDKEKEMKMVLHCPPIYPLPEEIKKMEQSEIICRYCGVSYLIFHEFHQLNTKITQLETELQELRETVEREKTQREELELGRLEWETALKLEAQKKAEEKENSMRGEVEERIRDVERVLRNEFEEKHERKKRQMEEACQKISEEKEKQLRNELRDLEVERLKRQREELEKESEEREKVLSEALQKANKNLDELRKYLQQLEERLAATVSTKEEAEQLLCKEKRQGDVLRRVCVQQEKALRSTLPVLRCSGTVLADVRGFLCQMIGTWQDFKSQILQHSSQVFSDMMKELKHSSEQRQKMKEENENLTQQLIHIDLLLRKMMNLLIWNILHHQFWAVSQTEERKRREEQLSQQEISRKEHRGELLRLKAELEEKQERWLSCQQRCDIVQEQLSAWQQREAQMNRKYRTAKDEVTRLRETLEKVQQKTKELKRERDVLIESHDRALTKVEEDVRQQMVSKLAATLEEQKTQSALHLRERMEEFRREADAELTIDREKNRLMILRYHQDGVQLQQKLEESRRELRGLKEELQEEKRKRGEQQEQEVLHLNQTKAELQLITERNAELQEEVALLQETVRRECEEREELTAALTKAKEELAGLRSSTSHHDSYSSPLNPVERRTPPRGQHFYFHSRSRVPLIRSSTSANTLRPSPACTDKDRGHGSDGEGAGRCLESKSWKDTRVSGREKLPRLKTNNTATEVNHNISLVTRRKERL